MKPGSGQTRVCASPDTRACFVTKQGQESKTRKIRNLEHRNRRRHFNVFFMKGYIETILREQLSVWPGPKTRKIDFPRKIELIFWLSFFYFLNFVLRSNQHVAILVWGSIHVSWEKALVSDKSADLCFECHNLMRMKLFRIVVYSLYETIAATAGNMYYKEVSCPFHGDC